MEQVTIPQSSAIAADILAAYRQRLVEKRQLDCKESIKALSDIHESYQALLPSRQVHQAPEFVLGLRDIGTLKGMIVFLFHSITSEGDQSLRSELLECFKRWFLAESPSPLQMLLMTAFTHEVVYLTLIWGWDASEQESFLASRQALAAYLKLIPPQPAISALLACLPRLRQGRDRRGSPALNVARTFVSMQLLRKSGVAGFLAPIVDQQQSTNNSGELQMPSTQKIDAAIKILLERPGSVDLPSWQNAITNQLLPHIEAAPFIIGPVLSRVESIPPLTKKQLMCIMPFIPGSKLHRFLSLQEILALFRAFFTQKNTDECTISHAILKVWISNVEESKLMQIIRHLIDAADEQLADTPLTIFKTALEQDESTSNVQDMWNVDPTALGQLIIHHRPQVISPILSRMLWNQPSLQRFHFIISLLSSIEQGDEAETLLLPVEILEIVASLLSSESKTSQQINFSNDLTDSEVGKPLRALQNIEIKDTDSDSDSDDEAGPDEAEDLEMQQELAHIAMQLLLSVLQKLQSNSRGECNPAATGSRSRKHLKSLLTVIKKSVELESCSSPNAENRRLAAQAVTIITAFSATLEPSETSKTRINPTFEEAMEALQDPILPVRAYGIVLLRDFVHSKDFDQGYTDRILDNMMAGIAEEDSYLFLNAVQGLCSLADVVGRPMMQKIAKMYSEFGNLDRQLRIGEALIQIIKRYDAALTLYSDLLFPPLLSVLQEAGASTILKASTLSVFAQVAETNVRALMFPTNHLDPLLRACLDIMQLERVETIKLEKHPQKALSRSAMLFISLLFRSLDEHTQAELNTEITLTKQRTLIRSDISESIPPDIRQSLRTVIGYVTATSEDGLLRQMAQEALLQIEAMGFFLVL